jgi:hypothetical protein
MKSGNYVGANTLTRVSARVFASDRRSEKSEGIKGQPILETDQERSTR